MRSNSEKKSVKEWLNGTGNGLVIDANILFALLIRQGKTLWLFERVICYAPHFLFLELKKYYSYLLKKSGCSKKEFEQVVTLLQGKIVLVEPDKHFFKKADSFSPDPKDVQYLALALQLDVPLWSNDKALKQQDVVRVYTTHELLHIQK